MFAGFRDLSPRPRAPSLPSTLAAVVHKHMAVCASGNIMCTVLHPPGRQSGHAMPCQQAVKEPQITSSARPSAQERIPTSHWLILASRQLFLTGGLAVSPALRTSTSALRTSSCDGSPFCCLQIPDARCQMPNAEDVHTCKTIGAHFIVVTNAPVAPQTNSHDWREAASSLAIHSTTKPPQPLPGHESASASASWEAHKNDRTLHRAQRHQHDRQQKWSRIWVRQFVACAAQRRFDIQAVYSTRKLVRRWSQRLISKYISYIFSLAILRPSDL
jgi:hypothetical protein